MPQGNTGEKTEKPTAKKLRDARREGQVAKSRDLTQTLLMLAWVIVLLALAGVTGERLAELLQSTLLEIGKLEPGSNRRVGVAALEALVGLTLAPLAIVAVVGIFCEFLQVGPVVAPKRIAPKASHLSVTQGLKRIFAVDNLFETAKSLVKTAVIVAVAATIALFSLNTLLVMPRSDPVTAFRASGGLIVLLFVAVSILFVFVSLADWLYQRYSFEKKQRMSKQDVKRENKEQDGDPQTRGARRSLHREWATRSAARAARRANVVVVNPTHIAVALYYRKRETIAPVVSAAGQGTLARVIRQQAEAAGVPVIRSVGLARALSRRCAVDDLVPDDLFDAVAEVIAWAEEIVATRPDRGAH